MSISYLDYATVGVVIGHEIAHSLDSNSRKLMITNNNESLWTQDIMNEYKTRAKCFANQFNNYKIKTGHNVRTLNIIK